ncbi:MAG: hypothetical protein N2255_05120, partial [Kiritimatiellae bacterium]|nr:hypothetical protein [Kiritimatiellia bacterium]
MRRSIFLHSGWRLTWTEFTGNSDEPVDLSVQRPVVDASVPGDAHVDLMRYGLLPDLYVGMNLEQARWMEDKDWWYWTRFVTPAETAGHRVVLVFHGLDTFATVWLNDVLLGRTDNMHRRYEFEINGVLRSAGVNELVVRLASPRYMIRVDPAHRPLVWAPERLFCRKAQMSFGWDIAPRLLTVGIWRPVELVILDETRIVDAWVRVSTVQGERVVLEGRLTLEGRSSGNLTPYVQLKVGDTEIEWRQSMESAPGRVVLIGCGTVKKERMWWPVGYGEPVVCPV